MITFSVDGKWSHGTRLKGRNKNKLYGVNRVHLQVKVGDGSAVLIGDSENRTLVAPAGGRIYLRKVPADPKKWKGPGAGSMKVTISMGQQQKNKKTEEPSLGF